MISLIMFVLHPHETDEIVADLTARVTPETDEDTVAGRFCLAFTTGGRGAQAESY